MKSKRGSLHSLTLLASQNGRTALFAASENGHLPIVKFLVERGANLDAADEVASHQSASY
jgi:ankyrin repeat protein